MNNSITVILTLIALFLCQLGWSQSATNVTQNHVLYEIKSAKEMMAYNDKVVSKVRDFYNYLEIISNPKIEQKVREHTIGLTKKMFLGDVELVDFLSGSDETIRLEALLNKLMEAGESLKFTVSSTHVSLLKDDQTITYTLAVVKKGKAVNYELKQLSYIVSTTKNFGNKTRDVVITWLGEISD